MQGVYKLDCFPHCVHAAAAIEEQTVRRLLWTKLFSQRGCLMVSPICAAQKDGLGELDKSSWLGEIMRRP